MSSPHQVLEKPYAKEFMAGVRERDNIGFACLRKRIARDDVMHRGTATMLGWTFTPEQRQVLAYKFWNVFGAEASHNRWNRAISEVSRKSRI